jgi:hypothetical protein
MRTVATTPAWSESQNGGVALNGVLPMRAARADGDADTTGDNTLFETQGLLAP